jgi:hypothetical protein
VDAVEELAKDVDCWAAATRVAAWFEVEEILAKLKGGDDG